MDIKTGHVTWFERFEKYTLTKLYDILGVVLKDLYEFDACKNNHLARTVWRPIPTRPVHLDRMNKLCAEVRHGVWIPPRAFQKNPQRGGPASGGLKKQPLLAAKKAAG